ERSERLGGSLQLLELQRTQAVVQLRLLLVGVLQGETPLQHALELLELAGRGVEAIESLEELRLIARLLRRPDVGADGALAVGQRLLREPPGAHQEVPRDLGVVGLAAPLLEIGRASCRERR